MAEQSTTTPLADWQDQMVARGGLDCLFVCPNCGNTASPNDFKAVGAAPERATKECIGRHVQGRGCDWAAYGLFRGPAFVEVGDGKPPAPVFRFADERAAAPVRMGDT